ncbi:hypothetical protein BDV06DRAFT_215635 [Aspergillus oleicola]
MDLATVIEQCQFYPIPFDQLLHLIEKVYLAELERLKTAYPVSAPRNTSSPSHPQSPLHHHPAILYDTEYDEVNRTLTCIDLLRKIHNNDYAGFVGTETPEARRLTERSFAKLRNLFQGSINSADDLSMLVTPIVINDLGKSPSLVSEFQQLARTQDNKVNSNHDLLLYSVIHDAPHLVPCIARVPSTHREILVRGLKLGATLSFGQVAQAECPAVSFAVLEWMRGNKSTSRTASNENDNVDTMRAFQMGYLEQILDIAGALGHKDDTCAALLLEPTYQSYRAVYEVAINILPDCMEYQDRYTAILSRRMETLALDVQNPEHRAVMRLLCIWNTLVRSTVYDGLSSGMRAALVAGLGVDREDGRPAVQATYALAICSAAIRGSQDNSLKEQRRALAAVFRYLARVHSAIETDDEAAPQFRGILVLERDIRELALSTVCAEEF